MKKTLNELLNEFEVLAINHHEHTKVGDYKHGNAILRKLEKLSKKIFELNGQEEFLRLIYSENSAIAYMSSAFNIRFNTEECLTIFRKLSLANIPFISTGAEYSIRSWDSGYWIY